MSQSLAKIYIHLVFSTKGRTDTIPKANLEEVHAYVAEIFNNHGCPAIQVGGTANHIHILFLLGKQVNLSEMVRTVKSSTTRWINDFISLDNDNEKPKIRLSDDQVWQQIKEKTGVTNSSAFQQLDDNTIRNTIKELKNCGASHRQLERLTGIGRGFIQRI